MNHLLPKAKRLIKSAFNIGLAPRMDCRCKTRRLGSDYGGWEIALDGIGKDTIVYSFGVGEDASFDTALIEHFGLTVHAFDPTPKSIEWVRRQNFPASFVLHEYGLADFDGEITFHPPDNPDHVSHTILDRPSAKSSAISAPVKRLETIMRELGHREIGILKMDIEGAEYQVIEDLSRTGIRPEQILVEFHHRFADVGKKKTEDAISLLRKLGYGLFAVSDTGEEFSFILLPRAT